ncbi:preprotein translocase subunit SecY [Candidatus Micrarchaeota archaeon RBG_16_36_9]|nr:MAG: preprotein translocase subunit SecY [Candidatus Micrarchaeota archaeon RBG_16_36_9]
MPNLAVIASYIPSIREPIQKLTFREKAKWTLIILVLFFVLGSITVYGVNSDAIARFEFLEIVFGSRFGSIITLGIGPIVTASIILQLLVGSKIINWNLSDPDDKKKFSGTQKILTVAFCFIEGIAYVIANAVPPATPDIGLMIFVILQLAFGGIIIMFMDEVVSKWGFGSGVSLFIVAGVAKTILVRTLNPLTQSCGQGGIYSIATCFPSSGELPSGIIPSLISTLLQGTPNLFSLMPLIGTILVFIIVVFVQNVEVEIPMAFSLPYGKFASKRWPLKFLYTSNIPVILVAAVLANIQVLGRVLYSRGISFLGTFNSEGSPNPGGLMYYLSAPSSEIGIMVVTIIASIFALLFVILALKVLKKNAFKMSLLGALIGIFVGYSLLFFGILPGVITTDSLFHALIYISVYVMGSVIFSVFWTATSGMDAKSVAEQFKSYFIMIPGFRHDPRIAENVLDRYIPALTIMGGAFIGFLAAYADLTAAIGTGTGLLLAVTIIYQLYEQINQQHSEDMPPAIKKFLGD